MPKTLKQRLANGEIVRVATLGPLASPKIVEILGLAAGLDGVWFDQEHSAISHERLEVLALACRAAGLSCFVRLAPTDYASVMRPMEAGAEGVMVAQIRTVEEVKEIVSWVKYPPLGMRGLYMANYESRFNTVDTVKFIDEANRERWFVVQIETPEAVENAEAIAAVDGVDCLFVGPGDLACTLGVPGQMLHPKCVAALERVAGACRKAKKPWGILARSPEHAAKCRELGCQLFSLVSEIDLIHRGLQATKKLFAGFWNES